MHKFGYDVNITGNVKGNDNFSNLSFQNLNLDTGYHLGNTLNKTDTETIEELFDFFINLGNRSFRISEDEKIEIEIIGTKAFKIYTGPNDVGINIRKESDGTIIYGNGNRTLVEKRILEKLKKKLIQADADVNNKVSDILGLD